MHPQHIPNCLKMTIGEIPQKPIEATNEELRFSQHVPLFTSFDV